MHQTGGRLIDELLVLAAIDLFQTDDTKWRTLYATGILLLALLLLLVKLWGWMQLHRNAIQREIKRLEPRMLESAEKKRE